MHTPRRLDGRSYSSDCETDDDALSLEEALQGVLEGSDWWLEHPYTTFLWMQGVLQQWGWLAKSIAKARAEIGRRKCLRFQDWGPYGSRRPPPSHDP